MAGSCLACSEFLVDATNKAIAVLYSMNKCHEKEEHTSLFKPRLIYLVAISARSISIHLFATRKVHGHSELESIQAGGCTVHSPTAL